MATPYLSSLGQVQIGGEESEFGVETSNYVYLRTLITDRSGLTKAALRNEFLRTEDYEVGKILGQARGTFTTKFNLFGFSSSEPSAASTRVGAANASATAFDHVVEALASALGGIKVGGYAGSETVGATGTPTDTLTATDVSSFSAGMPIVWKTGLTDKPREIGWCVDVDALAGPPEEITLLQTPDDDPQGDTLWGGYCISRKTADNYHTSGYSDAAPSWSIKHTMADGTVTTMLGCRPSSVKITIPVGEIPTVEITWSVAHWSEATGGSLSVQTWSYPEPEATSSWLVRYGSGSNVYDMTSKSIEIDFGQDVQPVEGGYSDSGVESWITVKRNPMVTLSVVRESANEVSKFNNQTGAPLQVQIGSAAGRMFGLCVPAAMVQEYPQASDDGGKIVSNITLVPTYYSGDTGSASASTPIDTDFRIVFA